MALAAVMAASACGSPPTVEPPPKPGQLSLSVRTTGSDLDQNGYTVSLDGGAPQNVATNGTVTFSDVSPGSHQLTLAGVASNCAAGPSNPLAVSVQSGATASASFEVDCGVVMAAQGGAAATPDGRARVDVPSGALSDSTIISVVPAADSALPSGAAGYVTGSAYQYRPDGTQFSKPVQITIVYNPANVPSGASQSSIRLHTVQNGQWVPVAGSTVDTTLHTVTGQTNHFSIYGAVAAQPGVLQATTSTTGSKLDPDGYQLVVDGGAGQAIGINDTLDVTGLPVGDHSVELQGVASNCTVGGSNPRTVSVPSQDTARTAFSVTCTPQAGDLHVSVSTTGTDPDPDGYQVSVDGGAGQAIGINDSLDVTGLSVGSHTVELQGVAANCTVAGSNPRTVSVPDGGTTVTTFDVSCAANLGNLRVNTSTSGVDVDPDGYTVTLDGGLSQHINVNDHVTFSNINVGTHSVQLSGVSGNCTVAGGSTQSVDVTFNTTAQTTFSVSCVARTGSVVVKTSTTGTDVDPNGYTVTLDGGTPQPIDVNGSYTFPSVLEGQHSIKLGDVASNCSVSGSTTQNVTVTYGSKSTVTFDVSCVANVGSLEADASTSGTDQDSNGYSVTLDKGSPVAITSPTGTHTFTGVSVGVHSVALEDSSVAANCNVTGANPLSVSVSFGSTVKAQFSISCVANVGNVTATSSTTGTNIPKNFQVSLDGASTHNIKPDGGTYTFPSVSVGTHYVTLTVSPNCVVSGGATKTVGVTFGSTVTAAFTTTCF